MVSVRVRGRGECKGKGNVAPTDKSVQSALRKFVSLNNLTMVADGDKIGLKEFDGQFYDPDSMAWHDVWEKLIRPKQLKVQTDIMSKIKFK